MMGHRLTYLFFIISNLYFGQIFQWAKTIGGTATDYGSCITTDNSGNLYTLCGFRNTVDFDPNVAILNFTSIGLNDICISKLDPSGNLLWAKQFGGTSNDTPGRGGLALDNAGNIYFIGQFAGTCDFDPSSAVFNLTSNGKSDIFISKLDNLGNFLWAKNFGDTISDFGIALKVDASGNVFSTGILGGTVDFDPGPGIFNLTSTRVDVFVSKLDSMGNFVWTKNFGGIYSNEAFALTIDQFGNVLTTGMFMGAVDFDPGISTFNLTSVGAHDIFVSKFDNGGNFIWAKNIW